MYTTELLIDVPGKVVLIYVEGKLLFLFDEYVGEPIHHFVRGGLVCVLLQQQAGAVDVRNDFNHSILPFD